MEDQASPTLRCYYFNKESQVVTTEIQGFSDASELAYAAMVCLRISDASNHTRVSLVMSKSKVAPIKRLSFV